MNIIKTSLQYKHVTLSVLFLLFAVGIDSLLNMPRREDPKITIRQGLVVAYFPGANSVQVEDQVTKKLEQYLFQYEEVDKSKTYSTTKDGEVVVNVELTERVKQPDIFWSKLRHQLLISKQLDLPEGVKGPVVNSDFGDTEALVIGLESNKASYQELKHYAQKLEDYLRTIPAASKIKRIGEQQEEIAVSSTSEKLSQYGVNAQQVVRVLQSQNSINATGEVKTNSNKAPLYTNGYYNTETDLVNQVVGASRSGSVVKLGDVATLKRDYKEPQSIITVNGNKAMMLSIRLVEIEADIQSMNPVEEYQSIAKNSNVDLQIANLNKSKAALGIKSSRQSNIPELGLTGGYAHQFGNALLPVNNTFIGLSLKWDLQSIFSNKQIIRQRQFGLKQAEEHIINTELQVNNDIKKAYRKIDQALALIAVAQKSVTYRQEELKIQQDKQTAGLNKSTDLLNTKALLAKALADMYAAQLSYRLAISDLKILTGQ